MDVLEGVHPLFELLVLGGKPNISASGLATECAALWCAGGRKKGRTRWIPSGPTLPSFSLYISWAQNITARQLNKSCLRTDARRAPLTSSSGRCSASSCSSP